MQKGGCVEKGTVCKRGLCAKWILGGLHAKGGSALYVLLDLLRTDLKRRGVTKAWSAGRRAVWLTERVGAEARCREGHGDMRGMARDWR